MQHDSCVRHSQVFAYLDEHISEYFAVLVSQQGANHVAWLANNAGQNGVEGDHFGHHYPLEKVHRHT